MKVWKNTSTLNDYDSGLEFTESKKEAIIALLGSKPINLNEFPKLKGIYKTGMSRDNVPEKKAKKIGIKVRYPSEDTIKIILEETASFTCGLILKMLYHNVGSLDPWIKLSRKRLSKKSLLIIGTGNVGSRVAKCMRLFMEVNTFDILHNSESELKKLIMNSDCISLHIPKTNNNISFINKEKLSWMKNGAVLINTARGQIVNEKDLYNELKNKRLRAAFDVFWEEPYYGKLKDFYPNYFYMTPHVASTCSDFLKGCRKDLDHFIDEIS